MLLLIGLFLKIVVAGIGFSECTTPITMGANSPTITSGPVRGFAPAIWNITFHPVVYNRNINIRAYDKASDKAKFYQTKTVHKLGGWIYSIEIGVLASIFTAMALIFFATSGRKVYLELKDQEVVSIKGPDVDVDKMKKKVGDITHKVKEEMGEAAPKEEPKEEPKKEESGE